MADDALVKLENIENQGEPVADNAESPSEATNGSAETAKESEENKPANNRPTDEELTVEGYIFLSVQDAEKAKLDKKKIGILKQKVTSAKVSDMEAVYEKAISNKIFATPVGWEYLAKLREKLIAAGVSDDDLTPIPIEVKITNVQLPDEYHPERYFTPPKKKPPMDKKFAMALLIAMNIVLVALVVTMFVIAAMSETDNIINYKQNVTNRFAEWEESLKEREKAVRIKERDLNIQDDTEYGSEIDGE
ncbi:MULTISPECIES: hypothetical protein [unclassified Butyrivibrio]|uniref:hypothetical protein n=1 Tax=unclassified Butyrivibrio TaxID=2639466 RepID=UPI00040F7568|nr:MULTISPECIES: hypothetical protein [unclassified Butyrivibrio]